MRQQTLLVVGVALLLAACAGGGVNPESREFDQIVRDHPTFAKVYLVQQRALADVAESDKFPEYWAGMCALLQYGIRFPAA